ncbi:Acylphosphatase [Sodiomyces alkalinus F11]|uniref:acylphosphatase n=1 Tax=Sodiomyces alkalinus (strain CBS 110278 / VKM F-3762 / F11) TaxID=1314773 RepID=A0A3N2PZB8_SODAK|nr:Acylphosphatase [Sodiomyces alkalinus F11]ROT39871.1 Acylphosphatase [Sodiomyces alkalinus F11]
MIKRQYFLVHGIVQGVGFRFFTRGRASDHGLTGWCRNTPDDKVEGEVQGQEESIAGFLININRGPRLSRVNKVETEEREIIEDEKHFEIRH